MEIDPLLADRTSELNAKGKQKEVVVDHEISDVDMDEDREDVVLVEGTVESVESRKKAKGSMDVSSAPSSSVKLEPKEVASNDMEKGFNPSVGFFDLDDCVYDDAYSALQSHFDRIDLPAGIEASVPWFPDSVPKKTENPLVPFVASKSKLESSVSQPNRVNSLSTPTWFSSSKQNTAASGRYTKIDFKHDSAQSLRSRLPPIGSIRGTLEWQKSIMKNHMELNGGYLGAGKLSGFGRINMFAASNSNLESSVSQPKWDYSMSTSTSLSSNKTNKAAGGQSTNFDFKYVPPPTAHSNFRQFGRGNGYPFSNSFNAQAGYGTSSFPKSAMNTGYPLGTDATTSEWQIMKSHMELNGGYLSGGMYPMNDKLLGQDATVNGPSSINSSSVETTSSLEKFLDGDVLKRYESFKKFDTVVDHSDHHYAQQNSAMNQAPKNWAKKIQEEWKILEKDLPDTIFVRAYESRMDLLRAVIIGAEGTPYHDGLFFFDVCFPSNYPNSPPLVHYHSGGLRINPNLYNSGKVCLSLLNTWPGDDRKQNWIPGSSTMLQVLVSIQGLILNMKPYFNEPGFEHSSGFLEGEIASLRYNENTLIKSLKTMVYAMNKPPKNFEDLVIGHFQHHVRDILMACKSYTEGVQVGCVVKGALQDVDEGDNKCSIDFKNNVGSYIKTLVAAFKNIGAKEAEEFLFLSLKKFSLRSAPPPTPTPTPTILPPPPLLASVFSPLHFPSMSPYNQHW